MTRLTSAFVLGCAVVGWSSELTHAGGRKNVVYVSGPVPIDALYDAVHNPSNRGKTVHLAPGTYVLLAAKSPATGGALALQAGMTLTGSAIRGDLDGDGVRDEISPSTADPFAEAGSATIIDGSALAPVTKTRTDCSGAFRTLGDPLIHLARTTSVARLTVLAGPNPGIGEPAVLDDPAEGLTASITDVVVLSSAVAVTFGNSGCDAREARSRLTFTHNVIRGNINGLVLSNFLTGNVNNTIEDGPELDALVAFSRFYGSENGIVARASAVSTDGGRLALESIGNIFSGNKGNIFALGAQAGGPLPSVGNHLRLTSRFDVFGPTSTNPAIAIRGGMAGVGQPQRNTVDASITHATFIRETASPAEISIIGGAGGTDNHVVALIAQTTVLTSAGTPTQGSLIIDDETIAALPPNTVRLIGSPGSFTRTNPQFIAPADGFFVPPQRR